MKHLILIAFVFSCAGARAGDAEKAEESRLEAKRQIELGWSLLKVDSATAFEHFEAAITADPLRASVRVQRSKARLAAGNAPGALGDARDAISMEPTLGEAYAARAEANRALGRSNIDLQADYKIAAKHDPRFLGAYKALVPPDEWIEPPANESVKKYPGDDAKDSKKPRGAPTRAPREWGLLAVVAAVSALLGAAGAGAAFRRRRSGEEGSLPR
ncbi:MAG: hypothetical protein COV48_11230 [Elusimicrobia bacterium CG11_big_fil_rev_8_21_14_0_20_64_6]|nr:MAG: hypothetical protein COV48_11230 [Elusimicrobia bacterium CG11_big_fil_rev_8_21_14_0_20_64_6]